MVGSISSVIITKYSRLGVSLDRDLEGRDMSTRPAGLMHKMAKPGVEAAPRYYALWLCAAADPGFDRVTFFTDLFAGGAGQDTAQPLMYQPATILLPKANGCPAGLFAKH